jgi:hypothetical protein
LGLVFEHYRQRFPRRRWLRDCLCSRLPDCAGLAMENSARQKQDAFSRQQNVERYGRLLATATDEGHRRHLKELLDAEQQAQLDAGDPKHLY